MHFFITLKEEYTEKSPQRDRSRDITILDLQIKHREGQPPTAEIILPHHERFPQVENKAVWIWVRHQDQTHLLFYGITCALPHSVTDETKSLSLTAATPESKKAYDIALEVLSQTPRVDPLLTPNSLAKDPSYQLAATTFTPHWSRVKGPFTWSDMMKVKTIFDVGRDFYKDSLRLSRLAPPLVAVEVTMTAEWLQTYEGYSDIGPVVAAATPEGHISTLTPENLLEKWWQRDTKLRGTGYHIVESHLTPIEPLALGGMQRTPTKTTALNPHDLTLPITRFRPRLMLNWHYTQKRVETCCVRLDGPPSLNEVAPNGSVQQLAWRLNDITADATPPWQRQHLYKMGDHCLYGSTIYTCQKEHQASKSFWTDQEVWQKCLHQDAPLRSYDSATYFLTERGEQTIESALDIARARILKSTRTLLVRVEVPLEAALNLSLDQMMRLEDPRLPGGEILGKLVSYELQANGTKGIAFATLTMGCVEPLKSTASAPLSFRRTPSGVAYDIPPNQMPKTGHVNLPGITPEQLVEHVKITNPAEDQIRTLKTHQPQSKDAALVDLQKHPTDVRIELMDLMGSDQLTHVVKVVTSWQDGGHVA